MTNDTYLRSTFLVQYLESIIETLTPDDVRQLILAEDELSQCEGFTRIFPGPNTYTYFPYFENPRYYNMLFDAWEAKYGEIRAEGVERLIQLCRNKVHLDVEPSALNAVSDSLAKKTLISVNLSMCAS